MGRNQRWAASSTSVAVCVSSLVLLSAGSAAAQGTIQVPRDFATIQQAVDAAAPGARIMVARGRHCGATITKRLVVAGQNGAVIAGCPGGPALGGLLRIGFLLDGAAGSSPASGTQITGFTFDGAGVSDANLQPLAFGVFARFAHDVQIERNTFDGTVQAITNTAGDRWQIRMNSISGLTLFTCGEGGFCGGGDGIVVQLARGALAVPGGAGNLVNRAEDNLVFQNDVSGVIPDEHHLFSMVGILVLAADRTDVRNNQMAIPANPAGTAEGQGIVVTNVCCGDPVGFVPGARDTSLRLNDGRQSQKAVVVEGTGGENTQGLVLFNNRGLVEVEGETVTALRLGRTLLGGSGFAIDTSSVARAFAAAVSGRTPAIFQ